MITETLYRALALDRDVHVIPTFGQHVAHTEAENRWIFGTIPNSRIHAHDWIGGVTRVGTIPASMVHETTGGLADWPRLTPLSFYACPRATDQIDLAAPGSTMQSYLNEVLSAVGKSLGTGIVTAPVAAHSVPR